MINNYDHVYCIKCNSLVKRLEAMDIMKTGYYKAQFSMTSTCIHCYNDMNSAVPSDRARPL